MFSKCQFQGPAQAVIIAFKDMPYKSQAIVILVKLFQIYKIRRFPVPDPWGRGAGFAGIRSVAAFQINREIGRSSPAPFKRAFFKHGGSLP
jgi:hypothetical protein